MILFPLSSATLRSFISHFWWNKSKQSKIWENEFVCVFVFSPFCCWGTFEFSSVNVRFHVIHLQFSLPLYGASSLRHTEHKLFVSIYDFSRVTYWLVYSPDFFVVRINGFHGISVGHFRCVANIRHTNRKFHVGNSVVLAAVPRYFYSFIYRKSLCVFFNVSIMNKEKEMEKNREKKQDQLKKI